MMMTKYKFKDFLPLIAIFAIIVLFTAVITLHSGYRDTLTVMRYFEGFFFLVFGAFKLVNWSGFVNAYAQYDILAKHSRLYGYAYPLIELALAVGYLMPYHLLLTTWVTLILMIIGSIGVIRELLQKRDIPCACLGAVFTIPMTWVTLIEDVLMAVMALVMIAMLTI
ncbi:MAG: hypothetical protein K5Q00_00585 [Gammaproteobacteria bacterium]|nr:hypothetical protein [Gammaproteobacteria bacterium]